MKNTLFVSEIFGPTIQGEGISVGMRAMFLRLFGCNLSCSFCDTPYTWRLNEKQPHRLPTIYSREEECTEMNFDQITAKLTGNDNLPPLLVVTGGEPLLQQKELVYFFQHLYKSHFVVMPEIEIETAGTIFPSLEICNFVHFNVSPKLENSGNKKEKRYIPETLVRFADLGSTFKFVLTDLTDLQEIDNIVLECGINPSNVYIMFEGETREKQLLRMEKMADDVIKHGYNISPRLHSLIWGNKRGV